MATKLSTCFLSRGFFAALNYDANNSNVRFLFPSHRLLPASCKMRHRNLSANQRRQAKKSVPQRPRMAAEFGEEGSDGENSPPLTVPSLDRGFVPDDDVLAEGNAVDEIGSKNVAEGNAVDGEFGEEGSDGENSPPLSVPSLDRGFVPDDDVLAEGNAVDEIGSKNVAVSGNVTDAEGSDDVEVEHVCNSDVESLAVNDQAKSLGINIDGKEPVPTYQLEDLIVLIRSAEKNILLLNQARVRALEDLDRILSEKEALQGEINFLQMRLAETDARMKAAAQEKIHVELLEDQLEKLKHELTQRGNAQGAIIDLNENHGKALNEEVSFVQSSSSHSLNEDIISVKAENAVLKNDVEALKERLNDIKNNDERVSTLEKERILLVSSLKDLETKLSASHEDVLKLSHLKVECKDLWEKVENLQALLDKATKQADQAIIVLQQNQELRKKVDKLEESLEEAGMYNLSAEKVQQYNELMQQKINLLEERLEKSDEEIHTYVQLYQESVQEFQDTVNSLKDESKKRALDGPVEDLPWEFWSRVLLIIDGWLLEKKITVDDAKILREMVWKRDRRIRDAYMECREKNEREALSTFLKLTSSTTSSGLYVVHIAAEMAPVAKVGGLGDVVTGLGKALQKRGHLVEIILPKYDCMQYDRIGDLRALDVAVESYFNGKLYKNKIWVGTVEGLPVYFIEPHHPDKFFWRGQFYGEQDDFKRFSFFSRAALELLFQAGKKPDIIHCHDWQTAFVAPLYWDIYVPKGLNSARICFTCHNFEYQGGAPALELASCGLDVQQMNRQDRMQDNSSHDRINPVKGAVVFSNIVTTVSPTYAQEVRTAEGGKGLHSTLSFHSKKFIGILNGIDTDAWNPATDCFLEVQYNANDLHGKAENKLYAKKRLRLSTSDAKQPLVGCITRLVPQKGVHLIRHAIYRTLELGGQFVLLGSSPVPHIQMEFEGIASNFQNHEHVRLILKYDESLSHSIFAASDLFIIPSIFEPCGLTQMIAMRYGSIPIARKTGGLNDSVFDVDDDTIPFQFRNGFTFVNPDEQGLNGALERAFNLYRNNPEGWQQLVRNDMKIDFSWDSSASQYEDLYSKSVARARAAANRALT